MPPFHFYALKAVQLHGLTQQPSQIPLPASAASIASELPKGGLINKELSDISITEKSMLSDVM